MIDKDKLITLYGVFLVTVILVYAGWSVFAGFIEAYNVNLNNFTHLSWRQFTVGVIWWFELLTIILSLILCFMKEYGLNRMPWVLFIVFGIGSVNFEWITQVYSYKYFSFVFFGVGSRLSDSSQLILRFSVPLGAIFFLLKVLWDRMCVWNCNILIIRQLVLWCAQLQEQKKAKFRKYCLDNYGIYHNADELNRQEVLDFFWVLLNKDGYNTAEFNEKTFVTEPAKQDDGWDDLGSLGFLEDVEKIVGFSKKDITDEEYKQVKTFGELAGLVIKKAKEKKLKEGRDKEEVR